MAWLWDEVKSIDRDSHRYTRSVKEAIRIRLHPDNINSANGMKFPKRRCPRSRNTAGEWYSSVPEGTTSRRNIADRNASITADHLDINGAA